MGRRGQNQVTAFARSTITSTPEMITELTHQVLPSASEALLMFCTSSSRKAAPRKKKCHSGRPQRKRAELPPEMRLPTTNRPTRSPASRKYSVGTRGSGRYR